MASYNLAPIGNGFQFLTTGGLPLNAGQLFTYAAGTSTPQTTYTTSAGSVANANPIILGVDGRTANEIWLTSGVSYKFVLEDSLGNIIATYDNLTGINDVVVAASEWTATGYSPTYIGPTSFSVTGDRTSTYQQYRRIKATVAGGSIYGSIVSSIYAAGVTTVTLVMDSTNLDNSLTAVAVSFLSATSPSVPASLTFAGPLNEAQGTSIASAATVNLTTATGNYVHITGSTTITAITLGAGYERTVVFDGALTLTNSASLILPKSTNINTQAGDTAIFRGDAGGAVRCVLYQVASANIPLQLTASTTLDSTYDNKLVYLNTGGAAQTLTLPNTPAAGYRISIYNTNTTAWSINRSGANTIYAQGRQAATTLSLEFGASITLVFDGGTNWHQYSGNNSLGYGQTWRTYVPPTRQAATNYTNTTGKPIYVSIVVGFTAGNGGYLTVDGLNVSQVSNASAGSGTICAIVNPGRLYSFTAIGGGTITSWNELTD